MLDYLSMSPFSGMATRGIYLLLCVNCIVGNVGSLVGAKYLQLNGENVDQVFHSYIKNYAKNYASDTEHEKRKTIFLENWKMILHHNHQNLTYKMKLNKFADRTPEELASGGALSSPILKGLKPFPYSADEVTKLAKTLPKNFDMRREGYLSSVKDQGGCGSCWAFMAAGAVEGALVRKRGGRPLNLSEQALVDCVPPHKSKAFGCHGNSVKNAFDYIEAKGLPFENEYTYKAVDGSCHAENMVTTNKIEGYAQATPNNVEAMKVALYYHGPVTVQIYLSKNMRFYDKGIFFDPDCNANGPNSTNHGVVVVGYGTRDIDGVDYWILKNSHGVDWGRKGYALISTKDNNCFVLINPLYPIV